MGNFKLLWIGIIVTMVAGAACGTTVEPRAENSFPTPTTFPLSRTNVTGEKLDELIENIDSDGPVLGATAEPVDLDALIANAEAQELAELEAELQKEIIILVDAEAEQRPISSLVYGVANPPGIYLRTLQPTLSSWSGEGAVRFNWQDGNSWNLGSQNSYRNTPVSEMENGNQALLFLDNAASAGAETYMVLPTIGWVARDNSPATCSFISEAGTCTSGNASTCQSSDVVANPNQTSVPVSPADVIAFARLLHQQEKPPKILAILHEPELWGITHYDLHPNCTTYQEILETFILYGEILKSEFPGVELAGPATCCWFYYWNSGAGEADKKLNDNQDFLPWFLDQMKNYENENGRRLLDILDIHYFPENIAGDSGDGFAGELRLRAARSLWDPTYLDESWIREPIYLIPRMQALIDDHYPGTKFAISEWNFGAETTVNGGLAIADVLGVLGREGVYLASYWTYPPFRSPGFWAFKMYTNYNNLGGRFGDISVKAASNDVDLVSSYAAINSETGNLHLILINKIGGFSDKNVEIDIAGFSFIDRIKRYQYLGDESGLSDNRIESSTILATSRRFDLSLPPNSITHLVIQPVTLDNLTDG